MSTPDPDSVAAVADRLHSAAIHLLRRLRVVDAETGLSAPRLSALSVLVFAGPVSVTQLAQAEQVSLPTISRLATELEREGLVERVADPDDARAARLRATAAGRQLLMAGRARRVKVLAAQIAALPAAERAVLAQAATLLERLTLPAAHPRSTTTTVAAAAPATASRSGGRRRQRGRRAVRAASSSPRAS